MKKYNRSQEKINSLISINKYTNLVSDGKTKESSEKSSDNASQSKDRRIKGRVDAGNRKRNACIKSNTSRGRSADWGIEEQHQRSDARKTASESGLSYKDRRKHRTRCKAQGQKIKRLNRELSCDAEDVA